MFCTKCGYNNPNDGFSFCEKCGAPLEAAAAPQPRPNYGYAAQPQPQPQPKPKKKREPDPYFKAIIDFFKARELKGKSLVTAIVAASSALLLCVSVNGSFSSWLPALAAIILTALCVFKLPYATKLHAIVVSLFAARFLFIVFEFIIALITTVISGEFETGYLWFFIQMYFNSGWDIGLSLFSYAIAAIYWLMACRVFKQKKVPTLIIFILTGINALYALVNFFIAFTVGYKTVFFYLGWMAFCAVFVLLFLFDEEFIKSFKPAPAPAPSANGYNNGYNAQPQPQSGAASSAFCTRCGNPNAPGTRFCTKCGNPLE